MRSEWFEIVSGVRRGAPASAVRAALGALSVPFSAAVRGRRWLYSKGVFRTRRASVPVISVGNITVGGTGKTPLVEHLAKGLAARGRRPAVVMRGYAARKGEVSDEARLLRANLGPGVPVVENPDRLEGAEEAARGGGADVVLLDDGFQHLRLARELDIVALDATRPFGFGRLLPAGYLRECPQALARADVIVVTRADLVPKEELEDLRARVRSLAPEALVLESTYGPARLETLDGKRGPALDVIKRARVAAFSGIGNPVAFGMTIRRLGAEIVLARRFADHHVFTRSELASVAREAASREAALVLTTQKDATRIGPEDWPEGALPLYVLRGRLAFAGGESDLWETVEKAVAAKPSEKR